MIDDHSNLNENITMTDKSNLVSDNNNTIL